MRPLLPYPMLIGWAAAVCVLAWAWRLLVWAFAYWLDSLFPAGRHGAIVYAQMTARNFDGILIVTTLAGAVRSILYHPLLRPSYTMWLMTVPWSKSKPLPLGPVHLIWEDVAALALLAAFSWVFMGAVPIATIPLVFALGYAGGSLLILLLTRQTLHAYLIALAFGALVRFGHQKVAFLILTAALLTIATLGLRRSLSGLPWMLGLDPQPNPKKDPGNDPAGFLAPVGPRPPRAPMSLKTVLLTGVLLSWWAYAVTACPDIRMEWERERLDWPMLFALSGTAVGLIRYLAYRIRRKPPQSLWGRLRSLRFLIPRYSRIWISPLACMAAGVLGAGMSKWSVLHIPIICGLTVFALTFAALGLGPSYHDWCLTGNGHVVILRTRRTS